MKKIILSIFLFIAGLNFSQMALSADGVAGATKTTKEYMKINKELPEDVEKAIRNAVSNFSSSEKREYFNWYKDSYLEVMNRLANSGIPEQDANAIARRLKAMYGANYPKQLATVNDEIADYKNLVQRIKDEQKAVAEKVEAENTKSKAEIREMLANTDINSRDLENIELNAQKAYPDNYSLQKAYIKGSIQTYLELKQLIKK